MPRKKSLRNQIAKELSLSPSTISNYFRRGMPNDSVSGAVTWYNDNILSKQKKGKNAFDFRKSDQSTVAQGELKKAPVAKTTEAVTDQSVQGLAFFVETTDLKIKEYEEEINMIRHELEQAPESERGKILQAKIALEKQQSELAKGLKDIQKEIFKIEQDRKDSFPREEVESALAGIAQGIKQVLDRMDVRILKEFTGETKEKLRGLLEKEKEEAVGLIYEFDFE